MLISWKYHRLMADQVDEILAELKYLSNLEVPALIGTISTGRFCFQRIRLATPVTSPFRFALLLASPFLLSSPQLGNKAISKKPMASERKGNFILVYINDFFRVASNFWPNTANV